jgi:hypothetical protein
MRKIILSIALAAFVAGAYADIVVGNGKVETESRRVGAFSSISLNGTGTLRVHRGALKVEITSDSNILPYITATVSGDELRIGIEPFNTVMSATKLQFDVSLPELRGVGVAGSGDAYVDAFKGDAFKAFVAGSGGIKADLAYRTVELNCTGSGGFDAEVMAGRLDVRCAGSGGAYIRGSADRAEYRISGSGTLGARDFSVDDARIAISGSGKAEIKAARSLDISMTGSGNIKYWGNPSLTQRLSGSGRVSRVGD